MPTASPGLSISASMNPLELKPTDSLEEARRWVGAYRHLEAQLSVRNLQFTEESMPAYTDVPTVHTLLLKPFKDDSVKHSPQPNRSGSAPIRSLPRLPISLLPLLPTSCRRPALPHRLMCPALLLLLRPSTRRWVWSCSAPCVTKGNS